MDSEDSSEIGRKKERKSIHNETKEMFSKVRRTEIYLNVL